ncbi:MAG: hypothetical protein KJ066_04435 [Acidobacteria bacterium]|nr:hypothetical protein [Acidobacteriota bacterium]
MMMTLDQWDQAERRIVRAWTSGNVEQALQEIEVVLDRGNDEVRGRALVYRGSIQEEKANLQAAKNDFIQAVGLFSPGSYSRFTAELSVGHACEQTSEKQQAVQWYRAALVTCAQADEPFSGATATKALLALEPCLAPNDVDLARVVTLKSWQLLGLAGEPDLDDLAGTTEMLMRRASTPEA